MVQLRKNYGQLYICLTALILLQLVAYTSAENLKCVQCVGSGEKCEDNLNEQLKDCSEDTKYCYTLIGTNGDIERGCRKPNEEATCEKKNCVLTGDGKNNQLVCKKCDGSDEKCSQTDVSDGTYNKICEEAEKNCVMKVENKLVVRSCAADVSQCTAPNSCENCATPLCNAGIFPKNRIKCYHCNDSSCNDVKPENSITCLNSVDKDECYTKGESETTMIRGCKSDETDNKCSAIAEGCAFCNASDCNSLKYKRDQELQCHQCTGDATNAECFQTQTNETFNKCEKQILYNQSEYCYTQYEGDTIKRGCLHDNPALTLEKCNGADCKTCNQTGCNKESIEFTCIRCRSDEVKKCWNNAKEVGGERCKSESATPADGCFSGVWHDVAIRGCVTDASAQIQSVCRNKNNPQCTICYSKDCNTKKSAGTKNALSYTVMFLVGITLWKFK